MNDGVRRSLLAAKIAQMQAEDERELARSSALGLGSTGSLVRSGWGTSSSEDERTGPAEIPANQSVFDAILQRTQAFHGSMQQDGAGQA